MLEAQAVEMHECRKSLIPLQKYLSYEILPSEQPSGDFLGQKLTGSL